jgi:hypothetical protein
MRKKLSVCGTIAFLLGMPAVSLAWDGFVTGTIGSIAVTDGGNQGFRISVNGFSSLCTGNNSGVAYMNSTDSNYNTYVAALLFAKSEGSTVGVYTTLDSTGNCHIGYITFS